MSPLNPQYLTKKQTVFQKIADLVEKFKGIGGKVWYENSWKIYLSTENFIPDDIQVPKWVGPFIEHYEKSKKYDSIRKLILESKEIL